ncbi:MAG: PAS domain-containing protein [Ramlibacter sp.]|nr:PAS domain-containing protein [Ramlibacter sp.]
MQGRLSLRERLVILMVAAVLPIFALSIWFAARETRSRIDLAQSQLLFAASLLATSEGKAVDAAEQLLGAISAIPDLRSWGHDRARCQSYFQSLRERYPMYSNIGLLAPDGLPVCHASGTMGDASAADRAYFRDTLSQRRFVMGEAIVGRLSGRSAIPFALPVLENGEPVAVVFATLDLALAAQELSRFRLPDGARVMVADRRGQVLMEYPAEGGRSVPRITAHPEFQEAARNHTSGVGEGRDATGEDRIYAYAPSRLVGSEGFIVRVGMPRSAALAGGSARFDEVLLLLTLATLAAMGVTWWVGGYVIVKPAKQILGAVRRLEQGRLDARVPLSGGRQPRGEFARIGAAFNLMADSLQLRQIDLETELGRSRSAYAALDLVINSMQEALIAVTGTGQFLMFNQAAARLFPLNGPATMPRQWPALFGFYHPDGQTPYELDELPLVRSARGESGRQPLLFVRNAQVPEGRMLQCSWQPIRGEGGINGGLVVFTDVTELERLQAGQAAQFAQLQETQRKLIEAQRIGRVGNWELDLASGRLWWSDEVYGLFGVEPNEFEPSIEGFEQRVHPDDRVMLKPARDSALRDGKSISLEYRIVRPDGSIAWMHEIGEARLGDQGEPVWFGGVVQDVTERKRVEQALLASERELQDYTLMLQRAAEAAQLIMAHPSLEATLQEVADQARHVIGVRQALVTLSGNGRTASPARSVSGEAGAATPVGGLLTVPLVSRSGRHIGRLQISGKDAGGFTERDEYVLLELAQLASIAIENARLFTEIRELNAGLEARIAERTAELGRQEQLYRTLAEQAPEVVWNTDATGMLTFMNRAWYELVGGTPGDWLGHTGIAAIHPDDRAEVAANWLRCMQTLQTYTGVRRVRAKDGSYHTMSYKATPVLDDRGQVAFWVGIDADITEFKAIELALRNSNQELEAFSYSVSHDLRAPLGAIGGFSQALMARLEGGADERVRHYLARIQAGVEKMEQLIDALLSLAKVARAPLSYGPVDLTAIARETLEGLQMQHPDRRVDAQVQEGLAPQGDARLLRVMLENLLGNAWKFTAQRDGARIELGREQDGHVFFVRDNGVGFDMDYAGKLFGAFQRLHTEAEFPGTGIGLATVRRIVARHQGRVWAESRLGEGTTFFFTLSETAPPAWLAGQDPT